MDDRASRLTELAGLIVQGFFVICFWVTLIGLIVAVVRENPKKIRLWGLLFLATVGCGFGASMLVAQVGAKPQSARATKTVSPSP